MLPRLVGRPRNYLVRRATFPPSWHGPRSARDVTKVTTETCARPVATYAQIVPRVHANIGILRSRPSEDYFSINSASPFDESHALIDSTRILDLVLKSFPFKNEPDFK
jgi:hypothetical protein